MNDIPTMQSVNKKGTMSTDHYLKGHLSLFTADLNVVDFILDLAF
jgi:hypothetical protein